MKKYFVVYSLTEKYIPKMYKTKASVVKQISLNDKLKWQEFTSEEKAESFFKEVSSKYSTSGQAFQAANQGSLHVNTSNLAKDKHLHTPENAETDHLLANRASNKSFYVLYNDDAKVNMDPMLL